MFLNKIFLGVWCYCDTYVGTYVLVLLGCCLVVFLNKKFLGVWCYCDIYVGTYVLVLMGFLN